MKRTAERVLGIISVILNVLSIGFLILMLITSKMLADDPMFQNEMENSMYSSGLTSAEMEQGLSFMEDFFGFISGIGWLFVILGLIGIILTIIGAVKVNTNAKFAGILFLISGVISGIITIPGILLIIAGVLCLVRKPKAQTLIQETDENGYVIE